VNTSRPRPPQTAMVASMTAKHVQILEFMGIPEEARLVGTVIVRIDETTAPGRVAAAHAALQPYLATGATLVSDAGGGLPVRVATMLYDVEGSVLRLRLDLADGEPALAAFEE
jgi:hypothetical protein